MKTQERHDAQEQTIDAATKRLRVVHVGIKPGDVRMRRAARVQRDAGHEVILVNGSAMNPDGDGLIPVEEVDGFRTLALNECKPAWFRECILELEPDMVFAHELQVLFHVVAKWTPEVNARLEDGAEASDAGFDFAPLPCPLVYDSHEFETGRPYEWKKDHTDREIAWKERMCIRCVDHVIAPSNAIAARLKDLYFLPEYPTVILNSPFAPIRPLIDRQEVREALRIKPGEKAIAFAGYFTPDRMLHQLLRAWLKLGREWRLFMLGQRGETWKRDEKTGKIVMERPPIEREFERYGATFLGHVMYPWPEVQDSGPTMFDMLAAMDVAFSGSDVRGYKNWRLGSPNKVFEYAMSGVPQVLSDAIDPGGLCARFADGEKGMGVIYDNSVTDLVRKIPEAAAIKVDRDLMVKEFAYDTTQAPKLEEAMAIARRRCEARMAAKTEAA